MNNLGLTDHETRALEVAISSKKIDGSALGSDLKILGLLYRMAKLKARPPVLSTIFGITNEKARFYYKQATHELPKKGRMAESTEWFVETTDKHFQAAWLAKTYSAYSKYAKTEMDKVEAMVLVYEQYIRYFPDSKILFDRFHFLIRKTFYEKEVKMMPCGRCHGTRLEVKQHNNGRHIVCPTCQIVRE